MEWGNTVWSTQLHPFQSLLIDRQTERLQEGGQRSIECAYDLGVSVHITGIPQSSPQKETLLRCCVQSSINKELTQFKLTCIQYELPPSGVEDEMNSWPVAMTLHCRGMPAQGGGEGQREVEVPQDRGHCQLSAGDMETGRHGDSQRRRHVETETRAVHAILSPLLGFEKLSCFVSGDRLTHNMAYGALARGFEGLRFLSAKGLQGALKKAYATFIGKPN